MKKYTVDYFITKFTVIPTYKMIPRHFMTKINIILGLGYMAGCALGWCGARVDEDQTVESKALRELFMEHLGLNPISVNDTRLTKYKQRTPKARILAALYDIRAIIRENEKTDSALEEAKHIINQPILDGVI